MKEDIVKIGVLSTANIGIRSVIPAILSMSDKFRLVGIASRSLKKAEVIAAQYKILAFGVYEDLLDRNLIDAIYIPLPNSLHYYWVKMALERGIHVLVEKSLACDFDEVTELNNLAKSRGLSLIENFQFRFHRQLLVVKNAVDSGIIGPINYIRSSFEFPAFPDHSNIRYQKKLGGGALLDAGAYPIKISQIFLGLDISVKSSLLKYDPFHEVDIGGAALIQQNSGGIFSQISFGFNHFYQCRLEIFGKEGKISTDRIFTAPKDCDPVINIESNRSPARRQEVEADNAFVNMLKYFHETLKDNNLRESEYKGNVNQSRLLNEFNYLANVQ